MKDKYAVTKRTLCDQDWKTQLARGYVNIPENSVVKVLEENIVNLYGSWVRVEYKGNLYYVSKDDLDYNQTSIDMAEKFWKEEGSIYNNIIDRYNKK